MSSNINRVMLSGGLTRDPDYRQTGSGMGVLTFGIAVNDRRRDQQTGEWKDYPNFVDCTMFGKRADALSMKLRKGMKVAIEGKLRYSTWTNKDGQKRSKLEVAVDELEFMDRQQQQPQSDAQRIRDEQAQYVQATYYDQKQGSFYDDDCPFN